MTYGFGQLGNDGDRLVVVVDLDDRLIELKQSLIETMDALGDSFEQQRLPLLLHSALFTSPKKQSH